MTDGGFPLHEPVPVSDLLRGDVVTIAIDADAEQRRELAEFLEIPDVKSLVARLKVRAEPGRRFVLEGTIAADLVQSCVVTLEPVEARVEGPIRRVYVDSPPREEDTDLDPFDDDAPDLIDGGVIDAGAAICEYIALEMPPYPRAKDAPEIENTARIGGGEGDVPANNPFAVLAQLRDLKK
ncbi:MAG: hypothetical protein CMM77_04545 [Rhodospirillaceae bacterium]|nr:hypothetical protein [Magnetovibrio sp.]MAY66376.1 hypothetical protein [Rhodospirillaceae bacterium]